MPMLTAYDYGCKHHGRSSGSDTGSWACLGAGPWTGLKFLRGR
jgi:hypothetical protein